MPIKVDIATTILSDEPEPSKVGVAISATFEVAAGFGVPSGSATINQHDHLHLVFRAGREDQG